MDELLKAFLAASGGSIVGAFLLYVGLRLFDEPLRSLFSIAAAKEVEAFKNQLGAQLESFKADLQRNLDTESQTRAKRIAFLEQQLSQFYWPLHLRLQRDDAVWRRMLERESTDETRRRVARAIDEHVLLPNHREIVSILEKGLHLARMDRGLEESVLNYVRHVAVYTALRHTDNYSTDPYHLGEPYPKDLSTQVERRTKQLQAEFDQLIQLEMPPNNRMQPTGGPAALVPR